MIKVDYLFVKIFFKIKIIQLKQMIELLMKNNNLNK